MEKTVADVRPPEVRCAPRLPGRPAPRRTTRFERDAAGRGGRGRGREPRRARQAAAAQRPRGGSSRTVAASPGVRSSPVRPRPRRRWPPRQFVSTRASFAATPTGTLIHVFLYGGLDGLRAGRAGQRPGARPGPAGPAAAGERLASRWTAASCSPASFAPLQKLPRRGPARLRAGGHRPAPVAEPLPGRRRLQPGRPARRDRRPRLPGQPRRRARPGHRVPQRRHRQHAAALAGRHQRRARAEQRRLASTSTATTASRRPPPRRSRRCSPASTTRCRSRCRTASRR